MQRCEITPYEGTKPYIFVSYAHRDTRQVFPVLEELDRRGYRVWYDDGIAPGSEWPENIAQHLSGCALTLAFISPNSIASDNCRREVTFALAKKKPFLAIILEETEMSLGMEMQLSAQQCVMKYSYRSQERFMEKVCSCPDLEPCREIPAQEPQVEPEIPAQPESAPQEKPVKPPKAPREKTPRPKREKKPAKKGKTLMFAGIPVAAVLLLITLVTLVNALSNVKITENKTAKRDDQSVYLGEERVTAQTVEQINKLKKLEYLTFMECEFESGALELLGENAQLLGLSMTDCTGVEDLSFLTAQSSLRSLKLENCGVSDAMMPALELPKLSDVDLSGNEAFTDLGKLSGCAELETLDISQTGVTGLEALSGEWMQTVDFSGTAVADITALRGWTGLREVTGASSGVTDLSPLAQLTELTAIAFDGCALEDPDGVFQSLRLAKLDLGGTGISSLDPFANATLLTQVDIRDCQIGDLSLLEKSAATLKTLDLSGNPLDEADLALLGKCTALTELYLDRIPLTDLNTVSGCTGLTRFTAVGCGLEDISGLAGCAGLEYLRLADNRIRDISPLAGMNSMTTVTLDLGSNPVEDLSCLPKLQYRNLVLLGEQLDLSRLPEVSGWTAVTHYSDTLLEAQLGRSPFSDWYIYDCPADKRVAMEEKFGAFGLRFLDSEEALNEQLSAMGLN